MSYFQFRIFSSIVMIFILSWIWFFSPIVWISDDVWEKFIIQPESTQILLLFLWGYFQTTAAYSVLSYLSDTLQDYFYPEQE